MFCVLSYYCALALKNNLAVNVIAAESWPLSPRLASSNLTASVTAGGDRSAMVPLALKKACVDRVHIFVQ